MGVVVVAQAMSANNDPHPQPLPTRGRGADRVVAREGIRSANGAGLFLELGADGGGVGAELGPRRNGGRAVAAGGGRGVGDGAGGGGDIDAAQVRMHGEIGGRVDAGEGESAAASFSVRVFSSVAANAAATRPSVAARRATRATLVAKSGSAASAGSPSTSRPARATRGRSASR